MKVKILISPLARGAYFDEFEAVAQQEFAACFTDGAEPQFLESIGGLSLISADIEERALPSIARLSFVQGIFEVDDGNGLHPLKVETGLRFPAHLVHGWKYQGKTNEMVTQMAINIALKYCNTGRVPQTLLDPMAGKGTTLLWGLRYGLGGVGIEQDTSAISALEAHLKKQTKLHRLKHSIAKGSVGPKHKGGKGKFLSCTMEDVSLRLVAGDSLEAPTLLGAQRFDMIVTDLPYGVQFKGGPKRSPLDTVKGCARGWMDSLRGGGAMVIIYNTYQPSRHQLAAAFSSLPCQLHDFSAPHRMSESIVRDFLVITRNE